MSTLIREGNRSEQVADVQRRLRSLGIEVEDETGFFGAGTARAVRAFQQRRDILVDGIVGPHTWSELVGAGWRLGDRGLYLKNPPMRGDDVQVLQERLNALGFDAGREDGIFGRDTDTAIRSFQREYGVLEDGIFGPMSHAALVGLRVDRPGISADLREELRRLERASITQALVMIDPGHGGDDSGERGPDGGVEADTCWHLAALLAERLIVAGARARFTRMETEGPDSTERARRANDISADLFVSIHLNNNQSPTAEGASTYHFPRSKAGALLAERVQEQLAALGCRDCRSHARSYPILKETRMPAVLVEPAFITNPDEAEKLADPNFKNAVADAIASGILRYYESV